jgi:hypothetical protein
MVSTNQFVSSQIKSNMKGVKPQISHYDFEMWMDLRMGASMSNVVQKG